MKNKPSDLLPQIPRQKDATRLLLFASHALLVSRFVSKSIFVVFGLTFTFPHMTCSLLCPLLSLICPHQISLEFPFDSSTHPGDDARPTTLATATSLSESTWSSSRCSFHSFHTKWVDSVTRGSQSSSFCGRSRAWKCHHHPNEGKIYFSGGRILIYDQS